jgi:hypothetical protein
VKIYIGITQNPTKAKEYIEQLQESTGCFTEFGPFLSMLEAQNWLVYLKSLVPDFEEVTPETSFGDEDMWFGYTYEEHH